MPGNFGIVAAGLLGSVMMRYVRVERIDNRQDHVSLYLLEAFDDNGARIVAATGIANPPLPVYGSNPPVIDADHTWDKASDGDPTTHAATAMVTDGYIELDFGRDVFVRTMRVLHYNQYASRIPGTQLRTMRSDRSTSFLYAFALPFYDYAFNLRQRTITFPDNGRRVKTLLLTRIAGTVPLSIAALEAYSYQNQRFTDSTNGGDILYGIASYLNDGSDTTVVTTISTAWAHVFVTLVSEQMVSRMRVRFASGASTSPPGTLLELIDGNGTKIFGKSDFTTGVYEYHVSLVQ